MSLNDVDKKDNLSDDCMNYELLLDAYHDGETSAEETLLVKQHLGTCERCRDRLDGIKSVQSALRGLPGLTMSRDMAADLDGLLLKKGRSGAAVSGGADEVVKESTVVPLGPNGKKSGRQTTTRWSRYVIAGSGIAAILLVVAITIQQGRLAENKAPVISDSYPHVTAPVVASRQDSESRLVYPVGSKPANQAGSVPADHHTTTTNSSHDNTTRVVRIPRYVVAQDAPASGRDGQSKPEALLKEGAYNNNSLVAVYVPEQSNSVTDEIGVMTNDDGLYELKL